MYQETPLREARIEELWQEIARHLIARDYPLCAHSFWSGFGSGNIVRWWFAPSAETLRDAPPIRQVLSDALGVAAANQLLREIDDVFHLKDRFTLERRADLSNLPAAALA